MIDKDTLYKLDNKILSIIDKLYKHLNNREIKFGFDDIYKNIYHIGVKKSNFILDNISIKYEEHTNKFIINNKSVNIDNIDEIMDLVWNRYYKVIVNNFGYRNNITNFDDIINIFRYKDLDELQELYKHIPDFDKEKIEYLINAKKFDLI